MVCLQNVFRLMQQRCCFSVLTFFILTLALTGCPGSTTSMPPADTAAYRGSFTKTGTIAGSGTVTIELDNTGAAGGVPSALSSYAITGKLKDSAGVVPLSGTYEPRLGFFTASAESGAYRYNFLGNFDGSGVVMNARTVVFDTNPDSMQVDLFMVNPGGTAISAAAGAFRAAENDDDEVDAIPDVFHRTWGTDKREDKSTTDAGIEAWNWDVGLFSPFSIILSNLNSFELPSGTLYLTLAKEEQTLVRIKETSTEGIYDAIFTVPRLESQSFAERQEIIAAYLGEKNITGAEKEGFLDRVIYVPHQSGHMLDDTKWTTTEGMVRDLEIIADYFLHNYEQTYLKTIKLRSPETVFVRHLIMAKGDGSIRVLSYRWKDADDEDQQYTDDLAFLESLIDHGNVGLTVEDSEPLYPYQD